MSISWISLYPDWYIQETTLLHKHYPHFKIDQNRLQNGQLIIYGNLVVRPPGGAKEYPIRLQYPAATPYEHPRVTPIESLPEWTDNGTIVREVKAKMLDHRHQMPAGNLCLFQHETRSIPGGDILRGIDILKRAEQYFIGLNTGHWPPDTAESELDSHFNYDTDILIAETFYRDVTDGYGKFLFISDIYRLRDAQNGTLCPSIVIAMTEESNIIQNFDARKELSRVYPWITNKIWDSYNFILKDNLKEEDPLGMIRYGYWWSLPQEPLPFHDGSGLLKTLALTTNGDIDEAWRIFNTTLVLYDS